MISATHTYSGRPIKTLCGHTATVNAVCSNSQVIVSASDDFTLKLWNFHSYLQPSEPTSLNL